MGGGQDEKWSYSLFLEPFPSTPPDTPSTKTVHIQPESINDQWRPFTEGWMISGHRILLDKNTRDQYHCSLNLGTDHVHAAATPLSRSPAARAGLGYHPDGGSSNVVTVMR